MRATDPIIIFVSHAFEFFLIFVMVWTVFFFMALPIGMGKEEEKGRGKDVKKKAHCSASIALIVSALIYYINKAQ